MAIIGFFSRKVLAWRLAFGIMSLNRHALTRFG
jgi:hypothetical protein